MRRALAACCGLLLALTLLPSVAAAKLSAREQFRQERAELQRKIRKLRNQRDRALDQRDAARAEGQATAQAMHAAYMQVVAERDAARAQAAQATAERDEARRAIMGTMAEQVRQVALRGKLPEILELIFDPLRVAWPCGATVFQGESFWSIDLDTTDTDYGADPPTFRDCR